jgi:hypothetical protein
MGAGLKIESEEASKLAGELAELAGESVETAVTSAIRQRFEPSAMTRSFCPQSCPLDAATISRRPTSNWR